MRSYFFSDPVLTGLKNTITLTALSMGLALVVSVLIANLRLSDNPVLRAAAGVYVWFFRSVPLLVLLILWFNISLIYPTFSIPLPGGGWTWETRDLMTAYWSAVLAFGLQLDSTCAIATDGDAYCWGSNGSGELGTGTAGEMVNASPTGLGL